MSTRPDMQMHMMHAWIYCWTVPAASWSYVAPALRGRSARREREREGGEKAFFARGLLSNRGSGRHADERQKGVFIVIARKRLHGMVVVLECRDHPHGVFDGLC